MFLVQSWEKCNGEERGALGKKTQEGGASSTPTNNEERGHPFLRQGKLESGRYA
jgi:hypothetical protein